MLLKIYSDYGGGKKYNLFARQKKKNLTLGLSEKCFLNEQKFGGGGGDEVSVVSCWDRQLHTETSYLNTFFLLS